MNVWEDIESSALPCPCCGSKNLSFYHSVGFCLLICNRCGAKKRRGASISEFEQGTDEWKMQNLVDVVTAWNLRDTGDEVTNGYGQKTCVNGG